jgi:RNA polymerase sigma-70 factor (ECF subfamily)
MEAKAMGFEASDEARTDAQLLAAHVAGDKNAFGELVYRHRDRLWSVALRTTSDPEEAADALQDAFLSAFRRADQFRGEAAVTTWLHRIVVNACLDRLRRRSSRPAVPLPDDLGQTLADPGDQISRRDTQLVIAAALANLPPDQRAAIVLVDVEGRSIQEAAELLGCPTGTVKSRCSRGRARLAEELAFLRNRKEPDTVIPKMGSPAKPAPATPLAEINTSEGGASHV